MSVYEFVHGEDQGKRIWAIWSPTGSERTGIDRLPLVGAKVTKTEGMALTANKVPSVGVEVMEGIATVPVTESPVYLWLAIASKKELKPEETVRISCDAGNRLKPSCSRRRARGKTPRLR